MVSTSTVQVSPAERHAERVAQVLTTAPSWVQVIVEGELVWLIPSATDSGSYEVDQLGCTCRDAERRVERGEPQPCKHRDALFAHMARLEQSAPHRELCAGCNGTSRDHMAACYKRQRAMMRVAS